MHKIELNSFDEQIKNAFKTFDDGDVSIYESIDEIATHLFYEVYDIPDRDEIDRKTYNYDLSLLSLNKDVLKESSVKAKKTHNIDEMSNVDRLGYVLAVIDSLDHIFLNANSKEDLYQNFTPQDKDKFIENLIYLLNTLEITDFEEQIKNAFNNFSFQDADLFAKIQNMVVNKYAESFDFKRASFNVYNYDVSLLTTNKKD